MVFGLLGDLAKGVGSAIGTITGPIIGLSVDVVASTLNITTSMVKEAIEAGCESYEDVKNYHKLK